jgi:hypothetical protein
LFIPLNLIFISEEHLSIQAVIFSASYLRPFFFAGIENNFELQLPKLWKDVLLQIHVYPPSMDRPHKMQTSIPRFFFPLFLFSVLLSFLPSCLPSTSSPTRSNPPPPLMPATTL